LESEIAFLEDTVRQLSDALVEQQARIDQLEAHVRTLADQISEQENDIEPLGPDDPPPHY
jgi:SlyX protein